MGCVYALLHPVTSEIRYIGKTETKLRKRYGAHLRDKSMSYRSRWVRGLLSQGLYPIIVMLEDDLCAPEINDSEIFWIAYFKFLGARLANATLGGEGSTGYSPTAETRLKLSIASRGKPQSLEARAKRSQSMRGNTNAVGVVRTQSHKDKLSSLYKGIPLSEDVREKLSVVRRGRPWGDKQRENQRKKEEGMRPQFLKAVEDWANGKTQREITDEYGFSKSYFYQRVKKLTNYTELLQQNRHNLSRRKDVYEKKYANRKSVSITPEHRIKMLAARKEKHGY